MKPKKYQAGGAMESSPRPRMRPEDLMEGRKKRGGAPMTSPRPRARPKDIEDMMSPDTAVGRGNRAAMREAEDMRTLGPDSGMKKGGKVKKMKAGGKVRGAGIAQKGVRPCKMC